MLYKTFLSLAFSLNANFKQLSKLVSVILDNSLKKLEKIQDKRFKQQSQSDNQRKITHIHVGNQSPMKGLLNLAKQKRLQQSSNQPSSITQKSQVNKFLHAPSQMSEQPQDFDQNFQPQLQQIFTYAEFIGINLPEEEDLLWIARQGLQTQLPPDWEQAETEQGQIAYTNTRTGQVIFQHPCDQFYRDLVIKQRKKASSKLIKKPLSNQSSGGSFQPIGSIGLKGQPLKLKQPQPIVDPLVKMQRQKQQKRVEEQKRKEFTQKKATVKQKYQAKRQQVQKEYKAKQDKAKTRFNDEIQNQRKENIQKMSQQEKQQERKRQDQIRLFQKETKQKEEKLMEDRMKKQKQRLEKKYQQKRDEIRYQLQKKLKEQKRQIDQIYKEKFRQLDLRQKTMSQQASQMQSSALLQQEVSVMKSEIIRKKLVKYSEKLKQQSQRQKALYSQEVQKLQSAHNLRIKQLQQKSSSQELSVQSNQKLSQLIKQIEAYEKEQLKLFEYQLQVMKEMKRFQMEEQLQTFKIKVSELHKQKLLEISRDMDKEFESFKQIKEEEYQKLMYETEKKAKEQFLNGLKKLEIKYAQQEEITQLQNRKPLASRNNDPSNVEKQNLQQLNRMYEQMEFEQQQLRRQRQNIKLQIQNLRSQSNVAHPLSKMNEQQVKLYQLIQDKIRDGFKSR